jgi:hypothetical protein
MADSKAGVWRLFQRSREDNESRPFTKGRLMALSDRREAPLMQSRRKFGRFGPFAST